MHAPPSATPAAAPHQPLSLSDLFLSFTWLALQGFGGVLGVVQRELVGKKRRMTNEEFLGASCMPSGPSNRAWPRS